MPDDGMERDLIRGQLREKPMTRRNPRHSHSEAKIAYFLWSWLLQQPEPRGEVLDGDAGFRLRRDPDSTVGIDVAYISAELASATPGDAGLIDGIPVLAVEILSPSNTQEEVMEKVQEYLTVGVPLTWVVEPVFRTVTIYRPGHEPELLNSRQELVGDPHLSGFRAPVAALFR
ncbi:MAG: Uma2 family endonuclease [Gemmataceae bacterium]|nr:Uma2 family endonuclease [Gemmataceae bacterium]